jgi:hypothetical protein
VRRPALVRRAVFSGDGKTLFVAPGRTLYHLDGETAANARRSRSGTAATLVAHDLVT